MPENTYMHMSMETLANMEATQLCFHTFTCTKQQQKPQWLVVAGGGSGAVVVVAIAPCYGIGGCGDVTRFRCSLIPPTHHTLIFLPLMSPTEKAKEKAEEEAATETEGGETQV